MALLEAKATLARRREWASPSRIVGPSKYRVALRSMRPETGEPTEFTELVKKVGSAHGAMELACGGLCQSLGATRGGMNA